MDAIPKPPPQPDDEPKNESQRAETLVSYFFGNESESAVKSEPLPVPQKR